MIFVLIVSELVIFDLGVKDIDDEVDVSDEVVNCDNEIYL